jgi:GNAT superfamily N-acetyltransferase
MAAPATQTPLIVRPAEFPRELDGVRAIFLEYEKGTGISLCFQGFQQEVANLPGKYAPPAGRLLLGVDGRDVGCIALRPLEAGVCEMKRLYVRPSHRRRGAGRLLAARLIDDARVIGYDTMRLDTLETWVPAVGLYRSLGFQPTSRYNDDPDPHTLFMALRLR